MKPMSSFLQSVLVTLRSQNIYPNKCKPQQDWKSSTEIGSCPADSINIANSPNFEGCSDSVGIKMTSFVEKANSFSSYELLQDDSVYRCIDLEMSIKNGTLSENWRSKNVCTYDMDLARTTLMQTKTFFVRLFKCPGSSSVPNPYAGCFPVKRSVSQTLMKSHLSVLIYDAGGVDICHCDDGYSHYYSSS